jgi:hypothetical protein
MYLREVENSMKIWRIGLTRRDSRFFQATIYLYSAALLEPPTLKASHSKPLLVINRAQGSYTSTKRPQLGSAHAFENASS